ncbi:plasmid stabilization protein [Picosynechococcus sp. PCC 7003]|uniref:type II toxin-antitoxin system VapC family toxin n=1 Tax=Picosynechococcus sp. PCC 7003 TaxID=374981 RepID=UPI000810ADD9|nr:type II toxin-antitoxin system VapC family toxin [Picosynechococcus sp. PCC 7003]ANV82966.1 plasmid stabilization protein [Picosynechococcus sp. PCC 7003]
MIILDTNVLSELMKPQGSHLVKTWIAKKNRAELFITAITQAEILYGIATLPGGQRREQLTQAARKMFQMEFRHKILSFDDEAAIAFADISSARRRQGRPISQFDAQIAAICLINQGIIATRNIDDFHHCGIDVVNPWQS